MGKITFRADDDLVDELEAFDASKSEVMRDALRAYLDQSTDGVDARPTSDAPGDSLDALLEERIDTLVEEHLRARQVAPAGGQGQGQDVNVTIALEGVDAGDARVAERAGEPTPDRPSRPTTDATRASHACDQCGTGLEDEHVFCPNCGEKATHRVFCDCGDEVHSDWAFCPGCGRRTPAADVLESNQP